jgi:hypothetical protein
VLAEIFAAPGAPNAAPLRYQPGYLDPVGRTVQIGFRKLFR